MITFGDFLKCKISKIIGNVQVETYITRERNTKCSVWTHAIPAEWQLTTTASDISHSVQRKKRENVKIVNNSVEHNNMMQQTDEKYIYLSAYNGFNYRKIGL